MNFLNRSTILIVKKVDRLLTKIGYNITYEFFKSVDYFNYKKVDGLLTKVGYNLYKRYEN